MSADVSRYQSLGWYIISALFPILAVLVSWICFYSLDHHTPNVIVTISETVAPFPQNRIFAVCMNMEAVFILILYLIRNKILTILARKRPPSNKHFKLKRLVMQICTTVAPIGLSVVSNVTLRDHMGWHLVGAGLFFGGSVLYFLVSDSALADCGRIPSIGSRIVSWASLFFAVLYCGFKLAQNATDDVDHYMRSVSSLFQYFTAISIFVKVFLLFFDLPRHSLQVRPARTPDEKAASSSAGPEEPPPL
jgi:hypothetical protein